MCAISSTTRRLVVVFVVLLLTISTGAAVGFAVAQENQTNESADNESSGSSEDSDDGGTPQVRFFEEGENPPAITPDEDGTSDGGSGSESSNETTNESSNGSLNESGNESSSQEMTFGDLTDSGDEENEDSSTINAYSRPSASGVTDEILTRIAAVLYAGFEAMVEDVFNEGLGTEVPNNNGYRGILGHPEEGAGMFADIYYNFYFPKIIRPIRSLIPLMMAFSYFFIWPAKPFRGGANSIMKDILRYAGAVAVIVISWEVASFMLYISDAGTQWLLPDTEDLLNSPESGADEGIATVDSAAGPVGALLGITIFGWNAGLAMLGIQGARHIFNAGFPAILGLIFVFQFFGPRRIRQIGSAAFWGSVGALVMNWPTAGVLGFAHAVGFDFGVGGAGGTLMDAGVTMGLFALAVFLPAIVPLGFIAMPIFTFVTGRGSPLQTAQRSASKRFGWDVGPKKTPWGGGSYDSGTDYTNKQQSAQRDTQSRRRAMADGGYANQTKSDRRGYSDTKRQSPRAVNATGRPVPDPDPKIGLEQRRKQRFQQVQDGYRKSR